MFRHLPLLLLLAAPVSAAGLDGTFWKIRLQPDADAKAVGEHLVNDELTFKRNKIQLVEWQKFGFDPARYTQSGDNWAADQKSRDRGYCHWEGYVSGQKMSGTLLWTRSDGTQVRFAIAGKQKFEKEKKKPVPTHRPSVPASDL